MQKQKPKHSYSLYYPIAIAAVLISGIVGSTVVYYFSSASYERLLLERVRSVAASIRVDEVTPLKGSETDLHTVPYDNIKNELIDLKNINTDVRFIYVMNQRDGNPFFYADSESPDSSYYSPPGQIFYEASARFRSAFDNKISLVEGVYRDRWGLWLTALAPVIDHSNNSLAAVVGIDIDAYQYYERIAFYTVLPFATSLFISAILFVGMILRRREYRYVQLKSELVSIASHELRSPLNGIAWGIDALLRKDISSDIRSMLALIKGSADNLLITVNDILDMASAENSASVQLRLERVDIVELVTIAAKNFELIAQKATISIKVVPWTEYHRIIYGDPDKLKRLFNNVISNAVKYSLPNGIVHIAFRSEGPMITTVVQDAGIGIPVTEQSRIFKGFYRAPNAQQHTMSGTGLGLYYVSHVVALHKGKVWIESKERQGTSVFVSLPLSNDQ